MSGNVLDVNILVVDDNEVDVQGLKRGFAKAKILNQVRVAKDGVEALEILRGENGQAALKNPYVILLDLNMPRMDGMEFLREIRRDDHLARSVVFMLTTSKAEDDICEAYGHQIAGYIAKEDAGNGFITAINMLESFWRIVQFPR